MDLDKVLPDVGEFGAYQQLLLWLVLLPGVLPCGFHAYNQLFMAARPPHWCRVPELEPFYNYSVDLVKNMSIPREADGVRFASCRMFRRNYSALAASLPDPEDLLAAEAAAEATALAAAEAAAAAVAALGGRGFGPGGAEAAATATAAAEAAAAEAAAAAAEAAETLVLLRAAAAANYSALSTTRCAHGWSFDYSEYATTVVTEWDMVCDRDFYTTLALVLLGVGGLIGNLVFGYLQDSMGRRPAFFIFLGIECAFGVATAFAPDFPTWAFFRFGVGFTVPAILGTPYVLAIELVGPAKRTVCTILTNVAYSLGLVALAGVVFLVRDWRQLALATSVPFLSFFLYWWVLPESPRWLLARGRFEEAETILKKMARVNGRSLPANYMVQLKRKFRVERYVSQKEQQRRYGVWDLVRTPNLRRKTLIITFIWFTNTSVYVGLSYYAPVLGGGAGDEFRNFFLAGAVELPTYVFLWPAMEGWGRRWTLCLSMLVGGTACVATVLSQHDSSATLALYCVGKMGISSSFVVLPLLASELYPTVVRGLGMSASSVVGNLGPVIIPLVNYLGEEMLVLPLLVMGCLLLAGGACALLLPETLHQHLPQSLEDGEAFGREWSWRDCAACCPPRVADMSLEEKTSTVESPLRSLIQHSAKEKPPCFSGPPASSGGPLPGAKDLSTTGEAGDGPAGEVLADGVSSELVAEHTMRITVV